MRLLSVAALCLSGVAIAAGHAPAPTLPRAQKGSEVERDRIQLANGQVLSGRIVLEQDERVALQQGTRERWIPRAEIASIESVSRSHRSILQRFRELESETPRALLELAQACEQARLPHERVLFLWRVIAIDPENETAHEALGHRRSGRTWRVPVGKTWRPLADAERARADWRGAWELRSEHWMLRTNGNLKAALDTAFELEFLYDAFYRLFQDELELRELLEPIQAYVYAARDEMPSVSSTVGAYFDRSLNALYTYFAGPRPFALFHEATHGVLYNIAIRSSGSRGSMPAWLNEAWSDYMEGVLEPLGGGRVALDKGRRKKQLLAVLDGRIEPYGVHRILNFGGTDFMASTKQDLKYAQSYALLLYMLEGEAGRYRETFLDYLRDSMGGQGQASTFRRLFRRDLDAIEKGHLGVR